MRAARLAAFRAAILCAVCLDVSVAQTTRQTLENFNNTNITANGRGLITGPIVNSMFNQTFNGMGVLGDTNVWRVANTHLGPETFNIPIMNDTSSISGAGSPPTFWNPTYFGNPAQGIVDRLNRVLIGEAVHGSSDNPMSTKDWLEQALANSTSVAQLAVVSTTGQSAIWGAARSSDFRAWSGQATGGAQGVNGFALNDDTGPNNPIAAAITGTCLQNAGVDGICEAEELNVAANSIPTSLTPYNGVLSGTTLGMNVNCGNSNTTTHYTSDCSVGLIFAESNNAALFNKAIIIQAGAIDPTQGTGGGGIALDMASSMSLVWQDSSGATQAEIYGAPAGVVDTANFNVNGGVVNLANATSNAVLFAEGSGIPTFTTRSVGEKLSLSQAVTGSAADYAIGYAPGQVWFGVPINTTADGFAFYGGTAQVDFIDGTGNFTFNGSGSGAPTFTTRSVGEKITLSQAISGSAANYAMGLASGQIWLGVPLNSNADGFAWYGGTTLVAFLDGTGVFNANGGYKVGANVGVSKTCTVPATVVGGIVTAC